VQKRLLVQRPARSSWEEPIKRLIGVLERILGYEGSSGYDPEGMIFRWRRERRLSGDRLVGCSDCPKRLPRREMVEATEGHESRTWFSSGSCHAGLGLLR
jgi:hypothetical protein